MNHPSKPVVEWNFNLKKSATLREWFNINARRPFLFVLCFLVLAQFLAYSISVYRSYIDANEIAKLLANIFDLGIFQSNRLLVEKISALSELYGFKHIFLCDKGEIVFSSKPAISQSCAASSNFFESLITLPLVSSETKTVNFVYPLFYDYLTSLLFATAPAIVIILAITKIKNVLGSIKTDLIDPLAESIVYLDRSEEADSDKSIDFSVAELNTLFSAYRAKVHDIKELIAAKAELDKQASIGRITTQLSHDLRAPLGIFESLLKLPDERLPSIRESVKDALNRVYSMIDALKHGEVGNLVKRENSVLSFALGAKSLEYRSKKLGITLQVLKEEQCVWIDSLKIERAWMNLASNAIEAAKSLVIVEVSAHRDGTLFIRVSDDGNGVPAEIVDRLYERGATHGKPGGTGLGLAYVKQVMQGHGGDVSYKRIDGMTIFECSIPRALASQENSSDKSCENFTENQEYAKKESVSISMQPESLCKEVCATLQCFESSRYKFLLDDPENADLIVTNDVGQSNGFLERDLNVIDLNSKLSAVQIIERLKIKFGIS